MRYDMSNNENKNDQDSKHTSEDKVCGIIMPISGNSNEGYSENHWKKVRNIIERSARKVGFNPQLVSDADQTSIIQNNIVNNIYYNEIVVCDVSSKNPNVMFELGLRLAFNKPVVIVKDNDTNYTFDISIIQHLGYPRSLEFHDIERFMNNLADKIRDTYSDYRNNQKDSSFLSHFGNLEPQTLKSKDIDLKEIISIIANENEKLRRDINKIFSKISIIEQYNQNMRNCKECERSYSEDDTSKVSLLRYDLATSNMHDVPF